MRRLRPLVALCAALSLMAPAAVAAGVGAHLQWADHHAGHAQHAPHVHGPGEAHHHPPAREGGAEGGTTPGAVLGASGSHSHEAPEPAVAPAAFRQERTRSGIGSGMGAGCVEAGTVGPAAPAGDTGPGLREARGLPPDPGGVPPPAPSLIHLYCALLL